MSTTLRPADQLTAAMQERATRLAREATKAKPRPMSAERRTPSGARPTARKLAPLGAFDPGRR